MDELFAAENLSEGDFVSYARTIADKIQENEAVMAQVTNNTPDQTMLGDFPKAVEEAVLASESGQAVWVHIGLASIDGLITAEPDVRVHAGAAAVASRAARIPGMLLDLRPPSGGYSWRSTFPIGSALSLATEMS